MPLPIALLPRPNVGVTACRRPAWAPWAAHCCLGHAARPCAFDATRSKDCFFAANGGHSACPQNCATFHATRGSAKCKQSWIVWQALSFQQCVAIRTSCFLFATRVCSGTQIYANGVWANTSCEGFPIGTGISMKFFVPAPLRTQCGTQDSGGATTLGTRLDAWH